MWAIILFPGVVTVAMLDWILPYNFDYGQKMMFSIVFCIVYYIFATYLAEKSGGFFNDNNGENFDGCMSGLVLYVGFSVVLMFILALLYFGFKVEIIGGLLKYI